MRNILRNVHPGVCSNLRTFIKIDNKYADWLKYKKKKTTRKAFGRIRIGYNAVLRGTGVALGAAAGAGRCQKKVLHMRADPVINKYRTQRSDTTYQVVSARVATKTDRVLFDLAVDDNAAQKPVLRAA